MVEWSRTKPPHEPAHGGEGVPSAPETLDYAGEQRDRLGPPVVQQQDLGARRVARNVLCEGRALDVPPVARIVGPEDRVVAGALRRDQGALAEAPVGRPELVPIELHVAGYGPRALAVAGRVGDGVIIQLADPDIIQWIMATARKAAEEAGRDPAALKCIVSAPSHVTDDLADAREQVRWFPAMVSNHVQDLIDRYGTDGSSVPTALTDYVQARKFYDYNEHSRVGAKHGEFVTDEICDRFCVIGNVEQCVTKLRELESIGVDQFNIYLMTHGQEDTLQAYGDDILPQFAGARI